MESGKRKIVTAMSISMRVEIQSFGQGLIRGTLHSQYLEAPFEFYNFVRLIEKMETIFDVNGFPEKFLLPRTFSITKRSKILRDGERYEDMNDSTNPTVNDENVGTKCTFEIMVRFRQNATWQGQILWAEKNLKQNFRSVLEMLKLMDEALLDGDAKRERVEWGT